MADQNVTTQQILDAVKAQRGQIASLSTLIGGIKARLNDALAGQLTPEGQKTLNEIMSEIQGNTRAITDAIATNDDDPSTVASDGSGGAPSQPAGKSATSTTLSTPKASVNEGETVSLSAAVSSADGNPKAITGRVTFATEAGELAVVGLDSTGVAATSGQLPAGDHSITATYSGDDAYDASTSSALDVSVMPAAQPPVEQPPATPPADTTTPPQGQDGVAPTPAA